MNSMSGISSYLMQRYSRAILDAVALGRASPQNTPPKPHARTEPPLDNPARDRMSKLKEWRKKRAIERGVESDVIVSNDVLMTLARKNPRTLENLIAVSGLGPWKAKTYSDELLAVLHPK
jgi:superfamily II DNA helicase RecQ